ncbi:MAG: hydroxyphenylacetyl-CoA thioesterase PaaI [Rhodobacteraceae bacterium]|nr:hydroxyphenylacetyl-CoA thioesterase PaaI [Paracoccaceae bacterium]
MDAQERARRSAVAMFANDRASPWMGMGPPEVTPGTARMSLTVELHHCNGHYICHGAVIFGLADSAFAFACNSYNRPAVAQHNTITYLAPARVGDVLTAVATEVSRTGRGGLYDVTVSNQDGVQIAAFRGASRTIKGQHFEENAP